jgi:hypothetical protein
MSVLHTTGMFGWAGTPYVFQVLTRILKDIIRPKISGELDMYVDDGMGVGPTISTANDLYIATSEVKELLGSKAIADAKSSMNRIMDFIGWTFNLINMTITMARKNMLKMCDAFFCFSIDEAVPLQVVERMASLASRYAMLCDHMKPYTHTLHACKTLYSGGSQMKLELTPLAKTDVVMWRAFLALINFDTENYTRSIYSFNENPASVMLEYDASLFGFGVGVSLWSETNLRFELNCYCKLIKPYEVTNDSSNQNTHEYMAVMLGLLLIKMTKCAAPGFYYNIVGDNTTSLSWCRRGRVSSTLARRANIGFSVLAVSLDAIVADATHIAGVDNKVWDGLSRGLDGLEVDLPPEKQIHLSPDSIAVQYVVLCNPATPLVEVNEHVDLSATFLDLLGAL